MGINICIIPEDWSLKDLNNKIIYPDNKTNTVYNIDSFSREFSGILPEYLKITDFHFHIVFS